MLLPSTECENITIIYNDSCKTLKYEEKSENKVTYFIASK
jgi:hypothetical protein